MNELNKLRDSIDNLDNQLVTLLSNRFELTRQVGIYKKENNLNSVDNKRLEDMLERLSIKAIEQNINPEMVKEILLTIHNYVVEEHNEISGK